MASTDKHYYPDHLNPFGSDDEEDVSGDSKAKLANGLRNNDYPDYLSPFGAEDDGVGLGFVSQVDDYDNSLNPFGDDEEGQTAMRDSEQSNKINGLTQVEGCESESDFGEGNPFANDEDDMQVKVEQNQVTKTNSDTENITSKPNTPIPESLQPPPVPLPRTKSLLKKEQALRDRQQQQQLHSLGAESHQPTSLFSTNTSSTNSITTTTVGAANNPATGSFQRKKNKRNAPPVPVNFKRQVSGSLDAIEDELNGIGDELALLEKESHECQQVLKEKDQVDDAQFATSRAKFIECVKRKNSIVRRQKELMYRKRELKLDQIHSDIEYELRMIGNKQLSHRTVEDDAREKELLKKLVEIVEEKSDIVENLNKDTSCDSQDIDDALQRLNISSDPPDKLKVDDVIESSIVPIKNDDCDKKHSVVMVAKLSKIATLLPKGGTLRGTMKMKRKRLFKKSDSRPIER